MLPRMQQSLGRGTLFALAWIVVLATAHSELALSDFSAAHPLKIMPVGDSITDDCVINGAWRAPLQPLLEASGIAFTNVGRLTSAGFTGFTQRRHEGYCGSVIAWPGVFAVYNYSTTNAYLQKIVSDALAITNNRPDLILVLIGANDIGRGRDPWQVATNDMPGLLSVIFSNVPNANVLLAKTTTLQNAGLGYGSYATNVPIYNAALQAMVNQRRAQGENIFLADMFSAVDYSTMFLSDHLHPNPLGLKAIAEEWATRIETVLVRSNRTTQVLIHGGADWKYCDTGADLGTNWVQPDYDDSAWGSGVARLGYGDSAIATTVSYGADPTNRNITTYFRRPFVVPCNAVITNLDLRLARTGGAVVWLNGQELFRTNLPAGPIVFTNRALRPVFGYASHVYYPASLAVTNLATGTNWIAVEMHQFYPSITTLGFDMELIGSGPLLPTPSLSIAQSGNDIRLSWPAADGGGFALHSTTNLAATESWTAAMSPAQTNSGQVVVTQSLNAGMQFFRLQRPSPAF